MIISAEERLRAAVARNNPVREEFGDPIDPRLECSLGRARVRYDITEAEYQAGVKWRNVHAAYMRSITDPDDMSDDDCERAKAAYMRGVKILESQDISERYCKRKRVLHAVNALAVFDEPEALGDMAFTVAAAKVGLQALSTSF